MSMWLSSTQPHIALWGGKAGGSGMALRYGRSASAGTSRAGADGEGGGSSSASAAEAAIDVFDVTPPLAEDETERGGGGEAGGGGGGGAGGIDDGGCLLDAPVGMIRGQPGVMRYKVLNNR